MHSFAKEKTVIFVSHNMEAVKSICSKVIYLEEGTQLVIFDDKILHLKKGDKILFIGKKEVYRRTEQIIVDKIILK